MVEQGIDETFVGEAVDRRAEEAHGVIPALADALTQFLEDVGVLPELASFVCAQIVCFLKKFE